MRQDARARGIALEVRRRPPARDLQEAAELLGIPASDIAKTVVVRAGADSYLFAVVPGDATLSWPKMRALLGVSKMKFPSAQEAFEVVGHERGTITPLGSRTQLPTYVEQGLIGRRVSMGAGAHGYSVFVDVDQLVAGLGAHVADLVGEQVRRPDGG